MKNSDNVISLFEADLPQPQAKKNYPRKKKKKHLCNRRCPHVKINARGDYRCGIFTDAHKIIEGAVKTRRVSAVHIALMGLSKLTAACHRKEHVTVRALRRCSGGTYHLGVQKYPGKFTFFRAYSEIVYNNKPYKAGTGTITFSGLTTVSIPMIYGPLPPMPGVSFKTINGEFFMTLLYTKPLPISQTSTKAHWARFHWKIHKSFRWIDSKLPGFQSGVWDVAAIFTNTELVKMHGVHSHYVTSSVD